MHDKATLSRRGFLQSTATIGASRLLRLGAPALAAMTQAACSARDSADAGDEHFLFLEPADATDFSAIAARILPTTDTPGASEAGVIHFFDQAFAGAMSDASALASQGLKSLNAAVGSRFADLDAEAQDRALRGIENDDFFDLMYVMTLFGFFAMSKYGGNRNHVGWELLGFDGHHGAWQYPFGYYDAEVHGGNVDGE